MSAPFQLFGPAHIGILAATAGLGLLAGWLPVRRPGPWKAARWGLAAISGGLGAGWYVYRIAALGTGWRLGLPLELCDVALWITVAALVRPRQRLVELAYFWGLPGATVALLTPYLVAPLASVSSVTFLAGHALIVISALFLLGAGLRPRPGSWRYAFVLLNALVAFDLLVDSLLGANYMYLLRKPPIRSLLSVMGPWPWYILAADALAAGLFWGMSLPFRQPPAARN